MFEKPIDRDIKGVIKVGQKEEENVYQELSEYVVTNELLKHFREFFSNYSNSISHSTDDIGVWISGFFGSGKSHFLKILSYILSSDLLVEGRRPLDFFQEKIPDPMILADMERSAAVSTDVILFNIDSKSVNSSSENKILDVFLRVFNEMRGYSEESPFIAELEKKLDKKGKYDSFKIAFKSINGEEWEEIRSDFYFISDDVIESLVACDFMSEDEARNWVEKAEANYAMSSEKFAKEVAKYISSKGQNHRVVFLVDEVGQYIGEDTQLMLKLQSLTEDLGIYCHGQAWIIVTSQQNIDDILNVKGQDFSKIQGRFKTRLSLSSANVDEVIQKRILAKTDVAEKTLIADYPNQEPVIKNLISFKDSAEMKNYSSSQNFSDIYPFVPYQFNLLQSVLTSIREHGASGKHLADGERSMLALFRESGEKLMNEEEGTLVPFNIFYDALEKFIDHTHSSVIIKAANNGNLMSFDVEVLKVLFLIKYIKEIKSNIENITTLMISHINDDKIALREKVENSLRRLEKETLILKNGDIYTFLTNEEQDINREIKNELVESGEILDKASEIIFFDIVKQNKYHLSNRYNFPFNKSIDNIDKKAKNNIGVRVITPFYDFISSYGGQTTLTETSRNEIIKNTLKDLSDKKDEVILYLTEDLTVFDEIRESLQIQKYLTKHSTDMKAQLKAVKQEELQEKNTRIIILLQSALESADIYIKGNLVDIASKNPADRVDEALGKLIKQVYFKLDYMENAPEDKDILSAIEDNSLDGFINSEIPSSRALSDVFNTVRDMTKTHEVLTLNTILTRYNNPPYGYTEKDTQWLLATLFSQNNITFTLHSEPVTKLSNNPSEILTFLTKKDYKEKLLIGKGIVIGDKERKATKSIYKELFNTTIQTDNDEKIMMDFKSRVEDKLANINDCLSEFKHLDIYPGKKVLIEAQELLVNVKGNKGIEQFYQYVSNHEDDLLHMADELDPVLQFFNGNQISIFREAHDIYKQYLDNKNLLSSSKLEDCANSIKRILDMPSPYSYIKDLPVLCDEYQSESKNILNLEKEPVKSDIANALNSTIEYLNGSELEEKDSMLERINNSFKNLDKKLINASSIAVIKGIADEAYNISSDYKDLIDKEVKKQSPGNVDPPEPPVNEIDLNLVSIAAATKIKIKKQEDIDELVSLIKSKLEEKLDDNTVINLKL